MNIFPLVDLNIFVSSFMNGLIISLAILLFEFWSFFFFCKEFIVNHWYPWKIWVTQFYQSVIFLAYNIAHNLHSEMFTKLRSSIIYICFKKHVYLAALGLGCGTWDLQSDAACRTFSCGVWGLVPWPRTQPAPPALGVWNLSHWTTREVPKLFYILKYIF